MMKRLIFLLPLLALSCIFSPAPGSQKYVDVSKTVVVFEDLDEDGKLDKNDPPLADALVVYQFNQHGLFAQRKTLTDQNGEAVVTGTYTHLFDVGVAAPCGYRLTGEARQTATGRGKLAFGFTPESSADHQKALITFTLWQDADGNGIFDPQESPLADSGLVAVPHNSSVTYLTPDWRDINAFWLITDAAGQAVLDLGSSCGELALRVERDLVVTGTQPNAIMNDDVLIFPYAAGEQEIQIGINSEN